jgi:hypothetical protein
MGGAVMKPSGEEGQFPPPQDDDDNYSQANSARTYGSVNTTGTSRSVRTLALLHQSRQEHNTYIPAEEVIRRSRQFVPTDLAFDDGASVRSARTNLLRTSIIEVINEIEPNETAVFQKTFDEETNDDRSPFEQTPFDQPEMKREQSLMEFRMFNNLGLKLNVEEDDPSWNQVSKSSLCKVPSH